MLPNGATWISLHSLYGLYGLCSSMEYLKKNQTAFNIEQKGKPDLNLRRVRQSMRRGVRQSMHFNETREGRGQGVRRSMRGNKQSDNEKELIFWFSWSASAEIQSWLILHLGFGDAGDTPPPDQIQPQVTVTDRLKLRTSFILKKDRFWLKTKKFSRHFLKNLFFCIFGCHFHTAALFPRIFGTFLYSIVEYSIQGHPERLLKVNKM